MHTFIECTCCGKQEDFETFRSLKNPIVVKMRSERLCFDCAYWMWRANNPETDTIIVDGCLYKLEKPLELLPLSLTRKSLQQFVVKIGTKEIYVAHNPLLRGEIPKRFSYLYPNQYKFITRDEYRRIFLFDAEMCVSKGCFDRYHCAWYNAAIAEPDGPWNEIPKAYKIGGEHCPSFIDKDRINDNE